MRKTKNKTKIKIKLMNWAIKYNGTWINSKIEEPSQENSFVFNQYVLIMNQDLKSSDKIFVLHRSLQVQASETENINGSILNIRFKQTSDGLYGLTQTRVSKIEEPSQENSLIATSSNLEQSDFLKSNVNASVVSSNLDQGDNSNTNEVY